MKVIFKKSIVGIGFHFRKNAEVDLPDEDGKRFVKAGFCVPVAEPAKVRAKKSVAKSAKKETR